jgi:squalene-hopene/tetraprenyl-beta-curcumene cyclase
MRTTRFASFTLIAIASLAHGCGAHPQPDPILSQRIEDALKRGSRFLASRQAADGLWRSDVYGSFKDPSALTPLVASALDAAKPAAGADERVVKYLAGMVRPDGGIDVESYGIPYPLYTAALTVNLLSAPERVAHAKAWAADLAKRQLDEHLGWQPSDPEYGGWGYAKELPRKPAAGLSVLPGTESNLSATTFALEALRQAGAGKEVFRKARMFIDRCQNYSDEARVQASPFDDGGFFFIRNDPVRNKAGVAGKDAIGRERYASYGSATADGIRALRACGVSEADPRLQAARRWLERSFRADAHPGGYASDREVNREALYYYYAFSVSRALRSEGDDLGRRDKLAEALLGRQGADGAWVNPAVAVREDDPLVATSFAVLALAACRDRGRPTK